MEKTLTTFFGARTVDKLDQLTLHVQGFSQWVDQFSIKENHMYSGAINTTYTVASSEHTGGAERIPLVPLGSNL